MARPRTPRLTAIAILAVVIAALARTGFAATRPLWYDELFTRWAAALPMADLFSALRLDSGPPLFYLLERPLAKAGVLALRLWPLLAGLALFASARALPPTPSRRRFVLLAAAAPLLTLYSAEARAYAPLALAGLTAFLFGSRGPERAPRLAAAAAAAAAACWLHYLGLLVAGSVLVAAVVQRRTRSALALAAGIASFLPWVPVLRGQPPEATAWMSEPGMAAIPSFLSALGGAGRIPSSFAPPLPPVLILAGLASGILGSVGLCLAARRDKDSLSAAIVVFGVLGGALAAALWRPIAFPGRTEMACVAIFLWGLAKAADSSAPARWAARATAAIGVVASLLLLAAPRTEPSYVSAPRRLAGALPENGLFVAGGAFYLPARVEKDEGRLAARLRALPAGLERHPGWFPATPPDAKIVSELEAALASAEPGDSIYLLLPPLLADGPVSAALASRGALELLHRDAESVLMRWTRRD